MGEWSDFTIDYLKENGVAPDDEVSLAAALTSNDKIIAHYAAIRIQIRGTARSLPALKEALHYPATDVKISALHAIGRIAKADGQDLYLAALTDPKFPEKMSAISLIAEFNDATAIPAVIDRLRKILGRKRTRVYYDRTESELTLAVNYLARFKTGESAGLIQQAYALVRDKWTSLEQLEQQTLAGNHPEFASV